MIIGFDGSRAFSKDKTGTENYSYQLLLHLAKIDSENQYIVYLRPGVKVDEKAWPSNFQFKVLRHPRLWTQIGLMLQTFTNPLDILFVPAHTLPIIRRPGLKTVMTVHDLGAEYLPKMHQLKQRLYLNFVTNFQLKSATKLIAVSEATKKDLINKVKVPEENIRVIYEGVNNLKSAKNDQLNNVLKDFGLEKGKYFLFVGTIQPRKNLIRLIKAFSKINNELNLVLVGGKGWLSEDIYDLPKKLGIAEKVKFLGRVEDEKLPALYSGAIALVYPSLFEGFGLPILEAQACGCPVITSNLSSMPEVTADAGILVNPYNIEEIAESMENIMKNDILRDRLVVKGYKNIKRFSWEKCAEETLSLFNSLARSSGQKVPLG